MRAESEIVAGTSAETGQSTLDRKLEVFAGEKGQQLLTSLQRGLEKEGLRVMPDASLAQTGHPAVLGSALTNPWLTTDFSESLFEFITPIFNTIDGMLDYLRDIHALAARNLGDERIWAASMPCILPGDDEIPIAQYGTSNSARMKTTYRVGLGHRYGRAMQTVAGIHYNFSMPAEYWQASFEKDHGHAHSSEGELQQYINVRYLDLIRNFRRNYWLLIYLLGAAPCFDRSFIQGREHRMDSLGDKDLYLPDATSLRMGDLGYQSEAQKSLFVCYNDLETYITTLGEALHISYPEYEKIGVVVDGEYQQLSTALLQIENEFYSPIRPKRVTQRGETPLRALADRGIEYVEVRCLDINPFMSLGIDAETIRFLDAFLLYCLSSESTLCDQEEFANISENQARIVNQGRDPDIQVYCGKKEIAMRECARHMLDGIARVAGLFDQAHGTSQYRDSVDRQKAKIDDVSLTPSAQILAEMHDNNESHIDFTQRKTSQFASEFANFDLDTDIEQALLSQAEQSHQDQAALEADQSTSFEDFLAAYFNQ